MDKIDRVKQKAYEDYAKMKEKSKKALQTVENARNLKISIDKKIEQGIVDFDVVEHVLNLDLEEQKRQILEMGIDYDMFESKLLEKRTLKLKKVNPRSKKGAKSRLKDLQELKSNYDMYNKDSTRLDDEIKHLKERFPGLTEEE